jgi:hypothetical protein
VVLRLGRRPGSPDSGEAAAGEGPRTTGCADMTNWWPGLVSGSAGEGDTVVAGDGGRANCNSDEGMARTGQRATREGSVQGCRVVGKLRCGQ